MSQIKFITQPRVGLSHLLDGEFKHNFLVSFKPMYNCNHDVVIPNAYFNVPELHMKADIFSTP